MCNAASASLVYIEYLTNHKYYLPCYAQYAVSVAKARAILIKSALADVIARPGGGCGFFRIVDTKRIYTLGFKLR